MPKYWTSEEMLFIKHQLQLIKMEAKSVDRAVKDFRAVFPDRKISSVKAMIRRRRK